MGARRGAHLVCHSLILLKLNQEPALAGLFVQVYRAGIDLLSVLQMHSRWVGARVGLLNVRNQRLATRIDLHLALGGSFSEMDDAGTDDQ